MKTYDTAFADFYSTYEFKNGSATSSMLIGWVPNKDFRMAPSCSCYERARHRMDCYILKYHPMYQKKYWTAKDGTYFKTSAKPDRITLTFKKIIKQALLALYLNDLRMKMNDIPVIQSLPLNLGARRQKLRMRTAHVPMPKHTSINTPIRES